MATTESGATGSPPTRRVIDVLNAVSEPDGGLTAADIARRCGITTSTCALIMNELHHLGVLTRDVDRRWHLGSGLLPVAEGLRKRYPLLGAGDRVVQDLHSVLGASCSLSQIEPDSLVVTNIAGLAHDGDFVPGQRFPLTPPYGIVAMAWSGPPQIESWLQSVEPKLSDSDIAEQLAALAGVHDRGYGLWRLHESAPSLRDRLSQVMDAVAADRFAASRLTQLLTMATLQFVPADVANPYIDAEFLVAPVAFNDAGVPSHQVQIRLDPATRANLTAEKVVGALTAASERVANILGLRVAHYQAGK